MRKILPILGLLLLLAGPAWAGSYDIFGTGSRAIAMGGAYTAISNDLSGLWYNTAAIAHVERLHTELGYVYAEPTLTINGREQDIDKHSGTTLGGILSTKIWSHRLSLGLNFFMPDAHLMRFLVLSTNQPHQAFTHNANHSFTTLIGAGVEIFPWMSAGLGVNLLASEVGGVNFSITEDKPSEGNVFSNLSPLYALMAGLHFQPLKQLRVGASFRDKVEMHFELPNVIKIPPLKIFDGNRVAILRETQLNLLAVSNSHFSPRTYSLGVAYEPTPRFLASADVDFCQWSAMRSDAPRAEVYVNGGLADIFPTSPAPAPKEPDFNDTFVYAVGVEGRPLLTDSWRLDLRGGYRYRPTPIPNQNSVNNYLDADTHVFSAGIGARGDKLSEYLPRSVQLDGYYQYQYSPERIYHKASANDFVGDLRFDQNWWAVGSSVTLRF